MGVYKNIQFINGFHAKYYAVFLWLVTAAVLFYRHVSSSVTFTQKFAETGRILEDINGTMQ
jgi:hypothetical protein